MTVSTYSADDPAGVAIDALPDHFWATGYTVAGAGQAVGSAPPEPAEFLVQSRPGRYLWLRLKLSGDGFTTPAVRSVRVHYPRDSYLDHLPAVFASYDEEGRWFLERLLAICQTEWDELERWIDDTPGLFDPRAVPAGPPLAELARWLALPLEETWDDEERRQLLIEAPRLRTQRGTLEGLKAHLRIYLRKLAGLAPEQPCNFPQIIEGFRERQRAMLGGAGQPLGAAPLWGPAEVGRLQSDRFAREGEARLVSVGEPEDDLFRIHAHRFRVYLPAAWVRDADAEAMLRRAIDGEKPAGTCYELCFVEPRLRVGVQSLLGLDTLIGSYTTARLTAAPAEGAAPNPTPQGRLGDGSMLPASAARPPGTRVDRDTCLH